MICGSDDDPYEAASTSLLGHSFRVPYLTCFLYLVLVTLVPLSY